MNKKGTILLTGSTGFLGSNLVRKLIDNNFGIIALKRSKSDISKLGDLTEHIVFYDIDHVNLESPFCNHKIVNIIHCATNYGRNNIDIISLIESNLLLPLKLLLLGKKYNVSCFINTDTILDKRINNYSLSKSQFKEWLKIHSDSMVCVNVALEHFYGPHDDETKFVAHIIRSIIDKVDSIDLTKGEQKRDFIFIDDVVDAFLKIIESSTSFTNGFHNYEIGTGHLIEIRDFVRQVKKLANNTCTHLRFGALPYRENEVMETHVDTAKIRNLGWSPRYSLEEGLKRTIDLEKESKKR